MRLNKQTLKEMDDEIKQMQEDVSQLLRAKQAKEERRAKHIAACLMYAKVLRQFNWQPMHTYAIQATDMDEGGGTRYTKKFKELIKPLWDPGWDDDAIHLTPEVYLGVTDSTMYLSGSSPEVLRAFAKEQEIKIPDKITCMKCEGRGWLPYLLEGQE